MFERKTDYPIHELIKNRWSARAMTGEEISDEELFPLFEAARWAPSCYNNQPWRFLYAKKNTPHWEKFFTFLVDFNKKWCANAAVLGVVVAKKTFDRNGKPSITYALDTGAAWENLSLEGAARGLVVHGMGGFDYERARSELRVPDDHEVLTMFAVGKKAPAESLPEDLRKDEVSRERKPIREFIFEGGYR